MGAEATNPHWLGLIQFIVIAGSLSLMMLSAVLIRPWATRITVVFVGMIFALLCVFIAAFWAAGVFFSFIIPK